MRVFNFRLAAVALAGGLTLGGCAYGYDPYGGGYGGLGVGIGYNSGYGGYGSYGYGDPYGGYGYGGYPYGGYGNYGGYGYNFWGPNLDLKPEFAHSYEFGTELGFLHDRLGVDATIYRKETKDQIVNDIRGSYGTGFILFNLNGASTRNTGVELTLRGTPIQREGLSWDFNVRSVYSEDYEIGADNSAILKNMTQLARLDREHVRQRLPHAL